MAHCSHHSVNRLKRTTKPAYMSSRLHFAVPPWAYPRQAVKLPICSLLHPPPASDVHTRAQLQNLSDHAPELKLDRKFSFLVASHMLKLRHESIRLTYSPCVALRRTASMVGSITRWFVDGGSFVLCVFLPSMQVCHSNISHHSRITQLMYAVVRVAFLVWAGRMAL